MGTGWSFPPEFTKNGGEVKTVSGVEDIHQSIQIILSTRMGERIMQEDFGADLNHALFAEMDRSLVNTINSMISDSILYHEPRVKLDKVDVSTDEAQEGRLMISLEYTVRSTNTRFNMVYPFYMNEENIPGAG
jgi:phage baseplate assembly protein W